MEHGLSFDIECYHQIVAKDYLGQRRRPTPEAERNTHYVLDLLADHNTRATFFVLGNIAQSFPRLVRRIVDDGHELGVHGFDHHLIFDLSPEAFRREIERAVSLLQDTAGAPVTGHRAPAFSVRPELPWVWETLQELGLRYDSSIFPWKGSRYGIPDAPDSVHTLESGLYEIPLTVVEAGGRRLPAAGGGYVRYFPYAYTRWAIERRAQAGLPAVVYFHPYEFEPTRPHLGLTDWLASPGGALKLARVNAMQSIGRGHSMRNKLRAMLEDFRFVPLEALLPGEAASA